MTDPMRKKKRRTPKALSLLRYKQKSPIGVGSTKATRKRKADAHERSVKDQVRAACVERDGYCRVASLAKQDTRMWQADEFPCSGWSEWAHLGEHRRAKTRGQIPEARHTVAGSLQLCTAHHFAYDERTLTIDPLTDLGANGPLWIQRTR